MKKTWIIIIVIAVIAFMLYRLVAGSYNSMVAQDEVVKTQWAQVENVYQRRADLIPNLVATVKGYADFEQETLTKVIEARASATNTKIDPDQLTPENMAKFQQAQNSLSGALSRLLVVVERYPDLKANQGFLELQAQLEGTENRIAVERNRFNDTVREFNILVRTFPRNFIAGMFGFTTKAQFEADAGAEKAPEVQF